MILLSIEQCNELAVPLIYSTMGEEIGSKAAHGFNNSDNSDISDLWALFDENKLIAVCGLGGEISKKKVWLGYFAVHPDYRNKGLGTKCLNFIENVAKERGYKWIIIETYQHPTFEPAIKLYKKLGYKEVGYLADYLEDGSDIIYLRKILGGF